MFVQKYFEFNIYKGIFFQYKNSIYYFDNQLLILSEVKNTLQSLLFRYYVPININYYESYDLNEISNLEPQLKNTLLLTLMLYAPISQYESCQKIKKMILINQNEEGLLLKNIFAKYEQVIQIINTCISPFEIPHRYPIYIIQNSIGDFIYGYITENNENIIKIFDYLYTINLYCDTVGAWYFNKMLSVLSILYLPIDTDYYPPVNNRNTTYQKLLKIKKEILENHDHYNRSLNKNDQIKKHNTLVDYLNYYLKITKVMGFLHKENKITHYWMIEIIISYNIYSPKILCNIVNENLLQPIIDNTNPKTYDLLEYQVKIQDLYPEDQDKITALLKIIKIIRNEEALPLEAKTEEKKTKEILQSTTDQPATEKIPQSTDQPATEKTEEIPQSPDQPATITTNANNITHQSDNKIFYFTVAIMCLLIKIYIHKKERDKDNDAPDKINNNKKEIDISNEDIIQNDDNIENIQ